MKKNTSDPETFSLGPTNVADFTQEDLEEIEFNLGPPGVDTDSLQDAKKKAYEEYAKTGLCASHISTYTETLPGPSMIRFAQIPEVEGLPVVVDEQGKHFEGKTKAAYIAKTW